MDSSICYVYRLEGAVVGIIGDAEIVIHIKDSAKHSAADVMGVIKELIATSEIKEQPWPSIETVNDISKTVLSLASGSD